VHQCLREVTDAGFPDEWSVDGWSPRAAPSSSYAIISGPVSCPQWSLPRASLSSFLLAKCGHNPSRKTRWPGPKTIRLTALAAYQAKLDKLTTRVCSGFAVRAPAGYRSRVIA
jgi:hypothetical protein